MRSSGEAAPDHVHPECYDWRAVSRILIAEDEPRLSSFLEKGLRAAGYTTTVCRDGNVASSMARDEDFDLLILDIGLPGQDGFEVLHDLRRRGERIPVLVLTGRRQLEDTVAALEGGADDYLTKPFVFDELVARVRARVRASEAAPETSELSNADLRLDLRARTAFLAGAEVQLTAREYMLVETFLRHRGEALSRDELLSRVWGHNVGLASNVVDVYVSILRRKLGTERFETIRGFGYRMPA
jgi:DNA-binding response OmpR family regulator